MSRIGVVGSGVVGFATGEGLAQHGHSVRFFDISDEVVKRLSGQGLSAAPVHSLDLSELDIVCVCVGTPLDPAKGVNFGALGEVTLTIAEKLRQAEGYPVIVYRSTVPPFMIAQELLPKLERFSGKMEGPDFGVAFWPEFLRADSAVADFLNPRAVVIATPRKEDRACRVLADMLQSFGLVRWFTFNEAALLKLDCNAVNTLAIVTGQVLRALAKQAGVDNPQPILDMVMELAEGRHNPAYGLRDRGPAGGSCLPGGLRLVIDSAKALGDVDVSLLEAAQSFNNADLQVGKTASA